MRQNGGVVQPFLPMVGRRLEVSVTESLEYLEQSLRQARTASQKERLLMLVWLKTQEVSSRGELAARCRRDKATITRWIRRYKDGGLSGLLTVGKAPGAKPKIPKEVLAQLNARLEQPEAGFRSYGEIQQWLHEEFGLELAYGTVYRVVRYQLKAKLKVPRPRSTEHDPTAATRFKKKIALTLKGLQRMAKPGQRIRYLCQDETRLGLKTLVTRLITACGVKPVGLSQWLRKSFWLYGAVEPLSGFSFFYEFSHLDTQCFQTFLDQLSVELGDDIGLLQIDRASAHLANDLVWPDNLYPTFQPSHSPELNPIERVWLAFKKDLAWQNCATLDELRERLVTVLTSYSTDAIASLTSYDFILEALFGAAL